MALDRSQDPLRYSPVFPDIERFPLKLGMLPDTLRQLIIIGQQLRNDLATLQYPFQKFALVCLERQHHGQSLPASIDQPIHPGAQELPLGHSILT